VNKEDSGIYTLFVSNGVGTANATIKVNFRAFGGFIKYSLTIITGCGGIFGKDNLYNQSGDCKVKLINRIDKFAYLFLVLVKMLSWNVKQMECQ
jgi:hypothetical protein